MTKKFKSYLSIIIVTSIMYISFNFYTQDPTNALSLEIECPKLLSYNYDIGLNVQAETKNEYIESLTVSILEDNIRIDLLSLQRRHYNIGKTFSKKIIVNIRENQLSSDARVVISTIARDKYGSELKKLCIYDDFVLINNPKEK